MSSKGKRPLNPYMTFAVATRPEVVRAQPYLKVTDVARELGARWRGLSEAEQAVWKRKAMAKGWQPAAAAPKKRARSGSPKAVRRPAAKKRRAR